MSFSVSGRATLGEIYRVRTHTPSLLKYANESRLAGTYNDVSISTGNDCFFANRMVLSCYSRFFEKMFKSEIRNIYIHSVEIECVDSDSMQSLIEFIYTGEININSENVCDLLSGADYLHIQDVKLFCFEYLEAAITPNNCIIILNLAKHYGNGLLHIFAKDFMAANFDDVPFSEEFKNFTKDELIMCILMQDRNVVEETSLYKAMLTWTKHDEENRCEDFPDLLELINLQQLPQELLEDLVSNENLVTEKLLLQFVGQNCSNLLVKAISNKLRESRMKDVDSRILSLGATRMPSRVIDVYNCFCEPSKDYPDIPDARDCGCSAKLHDFVYSVGGCKVSHGVVPTNMVWRLNVKEDQSKWQEICPMREERHAMAATVYKDCLFVAGGNDGKNDLPSVEFFSPILNTWKAAAPMTEYRSGLSLVSCKDILYAIGGFKNNEYLSSMERLLSVDGQWERVKLMQTPRRWLTAVNCNGFLYAIGGQSGNNIDTRLKSVEKYDTNSNEWSDISDMNYERSACSACVLQGRIFVVGGVDAEGCVTKEIECYDPLTDQWNIVGKTDLELFNHSLVIV